VKTSPQVRRSRGARVPEAPRPEGRLTLRRRVLLGYTVMLLLFGVVLSAALYEMRATQASLATLSAGYLPLSRELTGARSWPLGLELQPDQHPERLMRVRNAETFVMDRMEAQLQRAGEMALAMASPELNPGGALGMSGLALEVDECLSILASYRQAHSSFVEQAGEEGADTRPLIDELVSLRRQLELRLKNLSKRIGRHLSELVSSTERSQRDALLAMVGLSLVAFVLSLLLLVSTNFIMRPVRQLIVTAERIGQGKLDERVSVQSSDEVGRLATTFNAMADSLQEREGRLEERSRELEQALRELQASQEALIRSERLATIGQMAAQIAHEVRNPLNALGLNAELLADELDGGEAATSTELLAGIRAEVKRLTAITEDYLRLGRLPPLNLEVQPLAPLIDELVRFQEAELVGVGVAVDCEVPDDLPHVQVDVGQFRQALLNIVRNAAEALAERGGGRLHIHARADDGGVLLLLEDNGPGMDSDLVARVFDPFFSTKAKGSGLGLPLTQQVIEEHGGRIRCTSKVGEGTTFTIWLPSPRPDREHLQRKAEAAS
jgi:signal transduction histidine kinase